MVMVSKPLFIHVLLILINNGFNGKTTFYNFYILFWDHKTVLSDIKRF